MAIEQKTHGRRFFFLGLLLSTALFADILVGSTHIPATELLRILTGHAATDESWNYIVLHYRMPKALTALLVGAGLSTSGLLMQTLFRNPLAGPYVLGVSSGASLGVALLILGAAFLGNELSAWTLSNWGIATAASTGAFLVLFAILLTLQKIKNTLSILIIGLMFGSISNAVIGVLSYFSKAEQLQQFVFWNLGNLGGLNWEELVLFSTVIGGAILVVNFSIKPLDALLLGENYAQSMGVNLKKTRQTLLIATGLITGIITAFTGPIAFVGLAVPHLTKLIFDTSQHRILLPAVALNGALLLLICDLIAQVPFSEHTLPINAITSLFGAPVVIWLLVKKQKIRV